MENNKNEVKATRLQKPSKTGALTSLKGLKENFIKLEWETKELDVLIERVRKIIVSEL